MVRESYNINEIDSQVEKVMIPYKEDWQILQTIPGVDNISAAMLLSEIGVNMNCFGNKDRLSSWAGMCPGNNQSSNKKKVVAQCTATNLLNQCCVK